MSFSRKTHENHVNILKTTSNPQSNKPDNDSDYLFPRYDRREGKKTKWREGGMRTPGPPLLPTTVSCVGKYTLKFSKMSSPHVKSTLVGSIALEEEAPKAEEEEEEEGPAAVLALGKVSRLFWTGFLPRDWSSRSPLSPINLQNK